MPIRYVGERSRAAALGPWSRSAASPSVWLLQPLSLLFTGVVRLRRASYANRLRSAERAGVPVVSVGNLMVGGAGKTPIAGWVIDQLRRRGHHPALLHGGYAPDEPDLHRYWRPGVPVFSGKDRVALAQLAVAGGATALVLDDGFQHLRLARDLDIVLISADQWTQPHRVLPAGAWREPLSALAYADAIVITRKAAQAEAAEAVRDAIQRVRPRASVAIAKLAINAFFRHSEAGRVEGMAIAVCAIADPKAFAQQLVLEGVQVQEVLAFADHHRFTLDDLRDIRAAANQRPIVITEKDAMKLRALDPTFDAWVARQRVSFEAGEAELQSALERATPL
ncbi:MAG TPA: tetraacyldisaccharide 4'-kinase [Longimicrobiales bacterium]|nr:tetraacyldisaccharide 4'-kinase [Longimicrobiales bacterium]